MLNVAIYLADQHPHRDRSQGITHMTDCLLRQLLVDRELSLVEVRSRSSYRMPPGASRSIELPYPTSGKLARLLTDNLHALALARRLRPDVWFYPKGYLPLLGRAREPTVVTIHDTALLHYADHRPAERRAVELGYWLRMLEGSVRRASHVVTGSEHARRQIEQLCERRRLPVPPIRVVFGASDFEEALAAPRVPKGDYVMHLASLMPHKRTQAVLQCWQALTREGRDLPELLLVGELPTAGRALVRTLPGVRVVPRLEAAKFRATLGAARCLILASEFEGFGLPAIESYFLRTPVCFATGTAVDEILLARVGRSGYSHGDRTSFLAALEHTLGMGEADVQRVAEDLASQYGRAVFGQRVAQVLREAAR